jgi:hypothetical protein
LVARLDRAPLKAEAAETRGAVPRKLLTALTKNIWSKTVGRERCIAALRVPSFVALSLVESAFPAKRLSQLRSSAKSAPFDGVYRRIWLASSAR